MFIISGVYAHTFVGVGKGIPSFLRFLMFQISKVNNLVKLLHRRYENRKRNRM